MRVALSADHAGFDMKQDLATVLEGQGHQVLDLGTHSTAPVDYPDCARAVATVRQPKSPALIEGPGKRGYKILGISVYTDDLETVERITRKVREAGYEAGYLFVFAFALGRPFLGAVSFMGWIIIGIALYEAWKLNRRLPITGPLRFGGGLSVPAPAPVTPPGMPPPAAVT